jgi:DNA mismatch repair protein MutS
MTFFTDFQTRQDLNLLDRYSNKSVYAVFNSAKTAGASRLLEKMFNNPLTDYEAINLRSSIFKYFQEINIQFPVDSQAFSIAETYLQGGGVGILSSLVSIVRIATMKMVGVSEEYNLRVGQIQSTLKFCIQLNELVSHIISLKGENPVSKELQNAREVLGNQIEAMAFESEKISFSKMVSYDRKFRVRLNQHLLDLVDLTHHLDLYIAVAGVSRTKGFSYALAQSADNNNLSIINCKNPLVKFAKGNNLEINRDKNVFFLTGANMAGKSTLMKSVGIALYLAHMGFPVAADEMIFSVKDGLYTSINVSDNLAQGYSHYYAEVRRVKEVAEAVSASKKLFVIFDELFKGTNVKDAYDATLAVTEAFSKYKKCGFIISTHIIEVVEEFDNEGEHIQFFYLPTVMNGKIPTYTYNLTKGVSDDRHGMILIENEGILELLK